MQNKKRRGQQEQLQMPVSGEQAKSQYEKNGTVRDESIFCIEIKCQKSAMNETRKTAKSIP